ncbi:MAG: chemotaxis protein CheA [Solirubrobacteraceae bacterium]
MSSLLEQFLEEGHDLLDAALKGLLELEARPHDQELLDRVFRAAHTFKGAAGCFEFTALTRLTHTAEDVLSGVRDERCELTAETVDVLMQAFDLAGVWLEELASRGELPADADSASGALTGSLRSMLDGSTAPSEVTVDPAAPSGTPPWAKTLSGEAGADGSGLLIAGRYRPDPDSFFHGEDPLGLVRQLAELVWLRVDRNSDWPSIDELDEYACAVQFSFLAADELQDVEHLFRYVAEQVELVQLDPSALTDNEDQELAWSLIDAQRGALAAPFAADQLDTRLGAVAAVLRPALRAVGARAGELEQALAVARELRTTAPLLELIDGLMAREAASAASVPQQAELAGRPAPAEAVARSAIRSVKVDQAKIDQLMRLVGELIVAKNSIPFLARAAENELDGGRIAAALKDHHAVTHRIAEELQETVMEIRMLPVATVFQRFPRLVRDVSRKLGKQVRLVTKGEETTADKDMLESLAEPLVHIVRNSLDHGIESQAKRIEAGKPPEGTIVMSATQSVDGVIIEIRDDGAGIDADKLKRKAYERGLIDEQKLEALDHKQALNLVFLAGLSTAEEVSDLSGRGVGMDVVRNAIDSLGGSISVDSELGVGTTIRMQLPLSMAVSQLMLVSVAGQRFGIPVEHVRETVRVAQAQVQRIQQSPVIQLRGRVLPLIDLSSQLGFAAADLDADELAVLVVDLWGQELGLIVEDLHESLDLVVTPSAGLLARAPGLSGTALLGDGQVLISLNLKEVLANAA